MSKVTFTPIQPGDAASITNPNSLMTATNTATASLNQENVRVEGIDERNLAFPLIDVNFNSSGNDNYAALGFSTRNSPQKVPAGSSWVGGSSAPTFAAGVPFSLNRGVYNYAIVRYSLEVVIEGRVDNSTHNEANEEVSFIIYLNGIPVTSTQMHVQNAIYGSKGNSAGSKEDSARSVQSVTLFYPIIGESAVSTFTTELYYQIDDHGNGTPAPDTTVVVAADGKTATERAILIRRLTGSIVRYK